MIDREKVLKEFDYLIEHFYPACTSDSYYLSVMETVRELLKEQEAVVRCKDCKHESYCSIHETKFSDDWFCADGERQEGR